MTTPHHSGAPFVTSLPLFTLPYPAPSTFLFSPHFFALPECDKMSCASYGNACYAGYFCAGNRTREEKSRKYANQEKNEEGMYQGALHAASSVAARSLPDSHSYFPITHLETEETARGLNRFFMDILISSF